jgi:hypothetical protein
MNRIAAGEARKLKLETGKSKIAKHKSKLGTRK